MGIVTVSSVEKLLARRIMAWSFESAVKMAYGQISTGVGECSRRMLQTLARGSIEPRNSK